MITLSDMDFVRKILGDDYSFQEEDIPTSIACFYKNQWILTFNAEMTCQHCLKHVKCLYKMLNLIKDQKELNYKENNVT